MSNWKRHITKEDHLKDLDYTSPSEKFQIVHLITGLSNPDQYESVQNLLRDCYHEPDYHHKLMTALNEILTGHGIETIKLTENWASPPDYEYINQGDQYTPTIMYDCQTGDFFVSSWEDVFETHLENSELPQ